MSNPIQKFPFIVIILFLSTANSCTKKDVPVTTTAPSVISNLVSNITSHEASITCRITSNGNSSITGMGVCWAITPLPTIDSNKTTATLSVDSSFTITLSELKSGTLYYARAYAINSVGVSYSGQITFTTKGGLPQATTDTAIIKTVDTVLLSGKVTPDDLLTTVSFEYGTTTSYGNTALALQNSFSNGIDVAVSTKITGLLRNVIYHYRLKAENEKGTSYGIDKTFSLPSPDGTLGSVTDIDGNTYKTIVIGTQVWMMENLQTTKFNDGTAIPNLTDNLQWSVLNTAAYCWYSNREDLYKNTGYGALYNWYAVATGTLAPVGWHVPSEAEWEVLINYLGGAEVAAGKMKEVGLSHWLYGNIGATNSSGFTALAAGALFESGFTFMGEEACWWTATSSATPEYAFYHFIEGDKASIDTFGVLNYKVKGFSVRCVKN